MFCPKCRVVELTPEKVGDVDVERCGGCGGILLDSGEMFGLIRRGLAGAADPGGFAELGPPMMDEVSAHCGACNAPMHPVEAAEGVHVDLCLSCKAVFVDEGELRRLADLAG